MTGGSRRGRKLRHAASVCAAFGVVVGAACYSTGDGTPPHPDLFYYPVGLAVSAAGNVLYVANSDFDLQFNGGTVQSYDLTAIRNDTVGLLLGIYSTSSTTTGLLPFAAGAPSDAGCPNTQQIPGPPNPNGGNNQPVRLPLGQACAPPMDATKAYYRDSVTIGAFATDIQLSKNKERLFIPVRGDATLTWIDVQTDSDPNYFPGAKAGDTVATHYPPFQLRTPSFACNPYYPRAQVCGCGANEKTYRCDDKHHAGHLFDDGNTRQLTMPGEPFAMAFSDDGMAIALTHQAASQTSLFLTGFLPASTPTSAPIVTSDAGPSADGAADDGAADAGDDGAGNADAGAVDAGVDADGGTIAEAGPDGGFVEDAGNSLSLGMNGFSPSIQFIVSDLPLGGDGIVAVPHDPAAIPNPDPANPLRPAFLQTSNQHPEIDLLRYYSDEGYQQQGFGAGVLVDAGLAVTVGSSNLRPFLVKERSYSVTVNANGSNSRGIAIDPTPRLACESSALAQGFLPSDPEYVTCAQTPARVFIASRSPSSLILGQVGGMTGEGTYDPDFLTIYGNVPLAAGPSNIYVAPIVDGNGRYSVRVFIVCFDSQTIAIYDPDSQRIENVVTTAPGPFGMAFDPFDFQDVANHALVPYDPRSQHTNIVHGAVIGPALRKYRFAYLTSFTDSFVQVMDLDQSFRDDRLGEGQSTFENMVYTLGAPTRPVGAN